MLLDHDKFIGLLVENSGIEKEKIEKNLADLISDIKATLAKEGTYEIDGFGVFNKLGNNILFMPSEELETEINYKYVGMEPIELPNEASEETAADTSEKNPIQEVLVEEEPKEDSFEDPFAEALDEGKEEDNENQTEAPLVNEAEIEAAVEEEIENETVEDIFNELSDEQEKTEPVDEVPSNESDEEQEDAPGPDEWGIDAHKQEHQESAFAGLLGSTEAENAEEGVIPETDEIEESTADNEDLDFSALENTTDDEDFDDPFASLEDEAEENDESDDEDFVPVVTNVPSDQTETKEEPEEKQEMEEEKPEKEKKSKSRNHRARQQGSPVFLYMILALVVLAGTGYILAYFGIVNIEGITPSKYNPQVAQNTAPAQVQTTPPAQDPTQQTDENTDVPDQTNSENTEDQAIETSNPPTPTPRPEELPEMLNDPVNNSETPSSNERPLRADEKSPGEGGIISPVNIQDNSEPYGLTGTATQQGNNGYTIVLYTLSRKQGADAQFEKLSKDGYRVLIKEKSSSKYGVLYQVSIGQFKSLVDAAIAAERADPEILGNYIITKI